MAIIEGALTRHGHDMPAEDFDRFFRPFLIREALARLRDEGPMTEIEFTLRCPQCGSNKFKASSAKPKPTDSVTCAQCGNTVNLAAEKKRLEDEAREAL
jgi:ribosomal protein S27AE